jgi:hypothetical protein
LMRGGRGAIMNHADNDLALALGIGFGIKLMKNLS